MKTVEEQLLSIVDKFFNKKKINPLHLDLSFRNDLGLDSLSSTELILCCEEHFNIEIDVDHPATSTAKTLRPLHDAIVQLIDQNVSTK